MQTSFIIPYIYDRKYVLENRCGKSEKGELCHEMDAAKFLSVYGEGYKKIKFANRRWYLKMTKAVALEAVVWVK